MTENMKPSENMKLGLFIPFDDSGYVFERAFIDNVCYFDLPYFGVILDILEVYR